MQSGDNHRAGARWPSSCGFPGPDALREALLTEGPEKAGTPTVVCGGLASEEGFIASASLEVTQHIHHYSSV